MPGKDIAAFNLAIRTALRRPQVIYYIFPTYSQGRKVIFDSITNTGEKILDFIPKAVIHSTHQQELKIRFINGSILQIVGSDNYDALMGTNPQLCIFSEYALQDPRAYQYIRPILTANLGTAIFLSTPRGKNHLWDLYQIASNSNEWFCQKLTVEDTQHISMAEIERERAMGEMSSDLIEQEYYTSFEMGVEGSYYAKYLDKLRINGQITDVPWEPTFPVFSAWDLGYNDPTVIIFFQIIGQTIRIIDCYENNKQGLEHYARVVSAKPYTWGKHIGPHDIAVHDLSTGISRWRTMCDLGIKFMKPSEASIPHLIEDGIEAVRRNLPKMWIDEKKCKPILKALENYRQEFDVKRKIYKENPLHDWSSHFCFTADTEILTRNGMRRIIDVIAGDEVLTLQGWQKCTKSKRTQKNAKLVEVKFVDGTIVRCTPDHLFLTTSGWKSAQYLTKGTLIQSSLTSSLNTLMGHYIVYGLVRHIFQKAERGSIERCGRMLLGQYLKIATYIIETLIPLTTISGISNALTQKSILNCLDQTAQDLQLYVDRKLPIGIDPTQEDYGISDTLKELKVGRSGYDSQGNAIGVNESLRRLYEEMGMSKNFATQTAKPLRIASVNCLKDKEDVYDIGVPVAGHFSLSNGAIVHNCDAVRYMCGALPSLGKGTSPEELERRYREAYYGEQSNQNWPSVFKDEVKGY